MRVILILVVRVLGATPTDLDVRMHMHTLKKRHPNWDNEKLETVAREHVEMTLGEAKTPGSEKMSESEHFRNPNDEFASLKAAIMQMLENEENRNLSTAKFFEKLGTKIELSHRSERSVKHTILRCRRDYGLGRLRTVASATRKIVSQYGSSEFPPNQELYPLIRALLPEDRIVEDQIIAHEISNHRRDFTREAEPNRFYLSTREVAKTVLRDARFKSATNEDVAKEVERVLSSAGDERSSKRAIHRGISNARNEMNTGSPTR